MSRGFERRNDKTLFEAFYRHATFYPECTVDCFGRFQPSRPGAINCWFLGKEKLRDALLQLDVHVKPQDIDTLFYTLDVSDEEKGVDILEFRRAFQVSYIVFSYSIIQCHTTQQLTSVPSFGVKAPRHGGQLYTIICIFPFRCE